MLNSITDVTINWMPKDFKVIHGGAGGLPSALGNRIRALGRALSTGYLSAASVSPAGTGADDIIAVFKIPAGTLDEDGRGFEVHAAGAYAANGDSKRIKIIYNPTTVPVVGNAVSGGTTIADSGAVTQSGGGWYLIGAVKKFGAAAANTQIGLHCTGGATLIAPSFPTAVEANDTYVCVTANCATTKTDVLLNYVELRGVN